MNHLTNEEIKEKILEEIKYLMSLAGWPDLKANMENDVGIDSLDFIEIAMAIEEHLDIEIDDEILEDLDTVGDLVNKCTELYRKQNKVKP